METNKSANLKLVGSWTLFNVIMTDGDKFGVISLLGEPVI